jgi:hypothetical protein
MIAGRLAQGTVEACVYALLLLTLHPDVSLDESAISTWTLIVSDAPGTRV